MAAIVALALAGVALFPTSVLQRPSYAQLRKHCAPANPAKTPPSPGQVSDGSPQEKRLFDMQIPTESFLILVDKSGSMMPHMVNIRKEVKGLLEERLKNSSKVDTFADIIFYDDKAKSVLGKMQTLNRDTAAKLKQEVDGVKAGNGTELAEAIKQAVKEIKDHGKETTILILTDGEDSTIQQLIQDKDYWIQQAGNTRFRIHSTTPRFFFSPSSDPKPQNVYETGLEALSKAFGNGGRFGPAPTP